MPATPDGDVPHRLIFVHGFTQTHHHWHAGAQALRTRLVFDHTLAFVDLPGHGLSGTDSSTISGRGPAAVAAVGGAGTYIGYSMGGRYALLAALARPDLVRRLVVIGATAGFDDAEERAARRALDHERAAQIEAIGIRRFLDDWLAAPMFAGLSPDPHGLEHRRRNTVAGLAHSLRSSGTGSQPAIWDQLDRIAVPVLVIAGELDPKFTDVGRRLADAIPDATFQQIPTAGHAAHIEAEAATADAVAAWLEPV